MSIDQKNQREVDAKQKTDNEQSERESQKRSEEKNSTSVSNSNTENKSGHSDKNGDFKKQSASSHTEAPERKLTTPEKTVKEPTAQPGKDQSGAKTSGK